jgi:hypothetical protein
MSTALLFIELGIPCALRVHRLVFECAQCNSLFEYVRVLVTSNTTACSSVCVFVIGAVDIDPPDMPHPRAASLLILLSHRLRWS